MTMQQFISCLVSFEWLEPHPTHRKNSFLPTPHIQTYVKSMTHWLNDVLMSGKAELGWLELNPVAVAIEQLSNDLVEDLPLKENNLHRLYNALYPVEDEVLVREIEDWRLGRQGRVLKVSLSPLSSSVPPKSALITKCVEVY